MFFSPNRSTFLRLHVSCAFKEIIPKTLIRFVMNLSWIKLHNDDQCIFPIYLQINSNIHKNILQGIRLFSSSTRVQLEHIMCCFLRSIYYMFYVCSAILFLLLYTFCNIFCFVTTIVWLLRRNHRIPILCSLTHMGNILPRIPPLCRGVRSASCDPQNITFEAPRRLLPMPLAVPPI